MALRPIHYEPHPVSRERKAEIMAQGFRILDAKFKPKDYAEPAAEETPPVAESGAEPALEALEPDPIKPRGRPGRKPKQA